MSSFGLFHDVIFLIAAIDILGYNVGFRSEI